MSKLLPVKINCFWVILLLSPSISGAADFSGLKELPPDLLHGAQEEVRPEGILTLLAAGAGAAISRYGHTAHTDDFRIADTLAINTPLGKRVTDFGAAIGYPAYLMPATVITYFAGSYFDSRPAQEFGLLGFEALSLSGIETLILKYSVHRLRPDLSDRAAFPSGHTAASFSLAAVAASQWGWKVGIPSFLLASFVGYTRMEGKNHYLSDVLFATGVGIASGRAVYKVRRRAHPDRYSFAPFVSPGGCGVAVVF